jgi:hypothetical protein
MPQGKVPLNPYRVVVLARVVLRVLFATGAVFCLTNDRPCTVELAIYAILAYVFVLAIPLLSFLGQ